MKTKLAVFDFDDTIIDRSLESKEFFALSKLFSNQEFAAEFLANVKNKTISFPDQWKIFNESTNVTKEDVHIALRDYGTMVNVMDKVFQKLYDDHFDIILITNNHKFIAEPILANFNLLRYFAKVFARPSTLTQNGKVENFEKAPENWNGCIDCEEKYGFCKKIVLNQFINTRGNYDQIMYFGDGINDLCPAMSLGSSDTIFPRKGFKLEEALLSAKLRAHVKFWSDGFDILNTIEKL